jgi:hypothetical protein
MNDPTSFAKLTSRIADVIATAGSKHAETKGHIQSAYRSFFKRKIGALKLQDDHIAQINNLIAHMREPQGLEGPWLTVVLHKRSNNLGACILEVGPYKFAVVPFPNKAWEDLK